MDFEIWAYHTDIKKEVGMTKTTSGHETLLQDVTRPMAMLGWQAVSGTEQVEESDNERTWITAVYTGERRFMPTPGLLRSAMVDEEGNLPDGCSIDLEIETGSTVVKFESPPGDLETFGNCFLRYAGVQLHENPLNTARAHSA